MKNGAKTRYILSSRVALLEVLKKVVAGPAQGPVCCLMDRLDECSVDATRWLLARLRSMVDGPQTRTASHHHLKLILGSREVPSLEGSPCLRLEEAKSDIALVARVINSKMEKHSIFQILNPDFVAEVKDTLQQRYDGIFLWVRFAIDELVQVDGGPGIPERASSVSFTTYAMHFWAEHARDIVQYSSAILGVDRPFFQNYYTRLVRRRWWVEFTDDGNAGDELGMHMDYGGTPLHVYTALGMLLWVEKLLSESDFKAQIDQIDANSFTALHHASRSSSEESRMPRAQVLVAHGASSTKAMPAMSYIYRISKFILGTKHMNTILPSSWVPLMLPNSLLTWGSIPMPVMSTARLPCFTRR
ncbi:hypothetical protein DER46DRAFT_673383 [Fusarium sp. MPI-SDFR-AT-0072]|nr:hypothetical protein DER46DRAFT_673383 [Fusarium sp. MPI-SDFR-AT-0072]